MRNTRSSKRNLGKAQILVLISAIFSLAACRLDYRIEVHTDGSATIRQEIEESNGGIKAIEGTCDNFVQADSGLDVGIEDRSTERNLICKVTTQVPADKAEKGVGLTDDGDNWKLTISAPRNINIILKKYGYSESDIKSFSFTVSMPGKILKASPGGKIDKNKVTYTNINDLRDGVEVLGEKKPMDEGGFPVQAWFAIGAILLFLLVGIAVLVGSRRRKNRRALLQSGPVQGAGAGHFSMPNRIPEQNWPPNINNQCQSVPHTYTPHNPQSYPLGQNNDHSERTPPSERFQTPQTFYRQYDHTNRERNLAMSYDAQLPSLNAPQFHQEERYPDTGISQHSRRPRHLEHNSDDHIQAISNQEQSQNPSKDVSTAQGEAVPPTSRTSHGQNSPLDPWGLGG